MTIQMSLFEWENPEPGDGLAVIQARTARREPQARAAKLAALAPIERVLRPGSLVLEDWSGILRVARVSRYSEDGAERWCVFEKHYRREEKISCGTVHVVEWDEVRNFGRCVGGTMWPISEEEAAALGGEWIGVPDEVL